VDKNWCKRYARLRQEKVYKIVKVRTKRTRNTANRLYECKEQEDQETVSKSQSNTKDFVSGINRFYIRIAGNFYIFCDFFNLDPTDYKSEDKFLQFQEFIKTINNFTLEELENMIQAGWRLLDDN
jgi:hypothetical protein